MRCYLLFTLLPVLIPVPLLFVSQLGGIVKPNDGECHLNERGEYTHSVLQDYPSVSQVSVLLCLSVCLSLYLSPTSVLCLSLLCSHLTPTLYIQIHVLFVGFVYVFILFIELSLVLFFTSLFFT